MANRKRKKSVQILTTYLTGNLNYKAYFFVLRTLRQWCDALVPGDMVAVRCESAMPDKQYQAWNKWFNKKESTYAWRGNPELKCFTFYKQRNVE